MSRSWMKGKAFTGMLLVNDAGGLREGEKGDRQQLRGEADAEEVDGQGPLCWRMLAVMRAKSTQE